MKLLALAAGAVQHRLPVPDLSTRGCAAVVTGSLIVSQEVRLSIACEIAYSSLVSVIGCKIITRIIPFLCRLTQAIHLLAEVEGGEEQVWTG